MSSEDASSGGLPPVSKAGQNGAEKPPEVVPEVVEAVPRPEASRLGVIRQEEYRLHIGPLPDPKELAAYNVVIPDGANRIMQMAEAQSAHRIRIENLVVTSQQKQSQCGQIFGLIIGLVGIGAAMYAAVNGQPWFGGILGGGTLVSLVTAFLKSRDKGESDLREKREQMSRVAPGVDKESAPQRTESSQPPPS